jgi:hypothetical protein
MDTLAVKYLCHMEPPDRVASAYYDTAGQSCGVPSPSQGRGGQCTQSRGLATAKSKAGSHTMPLIWIYSTYFSRFGHQHCLPVLTAAGSLIDADQHNSAVVVKVVTYKSRSPSVNSGLLPMVG